MIVSHIAVLKCVFCLGNKVSKEIDKAAEKVEEVASNEGPKLLDKVT